LILDFGKPGNPIWRGLYYLYLRIVVPVFGLLFCGDAAAYSYILSSLESYPAQEGVAAAFRKRGCETVEIHNFIGGIMSIHRIVRPKSLRERDDIPLVTRDLIPKG
jgi:demethylmenaquinone methyltransferase/2-methoxy-6-polyprenyl-1,4-benzoquinol methylase